ncbi:MAG: cytochrome c oxidase subunit I, partial [Jatrophihabitantaceae bacterium]
VLTSALIMLFADRHFGTHIYSAVGCHLVNGAPMASCGSPLLWQNLFWFFGHPEVYILALPFFGVVTEVIPVFSRKPLFGYRGMIFATISIASLSTAVWAHHMFTTGVVLLPFFSLMSYLIAVPTGMKFFNWIGTMWRGSVKFDSPMLWSVGFLIAVPTGMKFFNWIGSMWRGAVTFETPMLFSLGFMVTFLFGGLTGVLLASPPVDFHVSDTYFVVAHFHYVLFGTIVFAVYSGIYFWFPKFTGRYLDEKLGKVHFWLTFLGFHLTFLVQHWLGAEGMPRRYPDYLPSDGFTTLNTVSTIGSFVLGASMIPFFWNVYHSYRFGEICTADDPWGHGNSLEWATSSPPPRHNFTSIPRIRSERPAFEYHYPHLLDQLGAEAHGGRKHTRHEPLPALAGAMIGSEGGRSAPHDPDPGT